MRTKIYFLRGENRFVVYVGKTAHSLEGRLYLHLYTARKGEISHKGNGIRALLRKGFTPTITLQTEVEGDGDKAEMAYIKWLRSKGIKLWNGTEGGDSGRRTSETKTRMSIAHTGTKATDAWRNNISKSLMGHKGWNKDGHWSEEQSRKIRAVQSTDAYRTKQKEAHKRHNKETCRCVSCMAKRGDNSYQTTEAFRIKQREGYKKHKEDCKCMCCTAKRDGPYKSIHKEDCKCFICMAKRGFSSRWKTWRDTVTTPGSIRSVNTESLGFIKQDK
jgi:hypothetical protein